MLLKRVAGGIFTKGSLSIRRILLTGLTPKKLSLTLCLGVATGIMPILWGTSILCAAFAALFRLNQGAIQAVNYCCYPLQIALFLPLFRLGQLLFPWGPKATGQLISEALHGHFGTSALLLGWATAKAMGAWLITAPPLALLSYPVLVSFFRHKEAGLASLAKAADPSASSCSPEDQ